MLRALEGRLVGPLGGFVGLRDIVGAREKEGEAVGLGELDGATVGTALGTTNHYNQHNDNMKE